MFASPVIMSLCNIHELAVTFGRMTLWPMIFDFLGYHLATALLIFFFCITDARNSSKKVDTPSPVTHDVSKYLEKKRNIKYKCTQYLLHVPYTCYPYVRSWIRSWTLDLTDLILRAAAQSLPSAVDTILRCFWSAWSEWIVELQIWPFRGTTKCLLVSHIGSWLKVPKSIYFAKKIIIVK